MDGVRRWGTIRESTWVNINIEKIHLCLVIQNLIFNNVGLANVVNKM